MPRVYLYGATLTGLIFTAYNIGTLLGAGVAATTGRVSEDDFGLSPERQAAIAIAGIIGWGIVWLGHWWYATAIAHGAGWRAESERAARLRVAYYVAAIGSMALATAIFAFMALNGAIRLALGPDALTNDVTEAIAKPLVSLIPWAAAWWLHRTWLIGEARGADDPVRVATAERLNSTVVALVGLGALAGGTAGLLGLLLDALLGGNRTLDDFRPYEAELAAYVAAAAVGAVLWIWNWRRLQARRASAPGAEADSTVRRAYLLIVVGSAVIASLGSLAFVLYFLFASILDVGVGGSFVSALSAPLGVLIVAVVAAIYHGLALRRDQALRAEGAQAEAGAAAAGEIATAAAPHRRVLVLTGPPDADLDVTVAAIRAALSPEMSLESGPPED